MKRDRETSPDKKFIQVYMKLVVGQGCTFFGGFAKTFLCFAIATGWNCFEKIGEFTFEIAQLTCVLGERKNAEK
jgi:hypothetical protein